MELGIHYAIILPWVSIILVSLGLVLSYTGKDRYLKLFWQASLKTIILGWIVYMVPFVLLDYRLAEVARNSSNDLDLYFRLATSWAGGGASLYFFATLLSLGLLLAVGRREPPKNLAIGGFFLLFISLVAALLNGAFDVVEGVGGLDLNPLLKNYWIVPHPTTTFSGYALVTAGALGTLAGLGSRPMAVMLAGWVLLSLGIVFGAYWSYETFGWGGYWGWDPVEVSQLTVWLAATAMLHMVGPLSSLRKPLAALVISTVPLALFVTRSGMSPLHSFAAANIGAIILLMGSLTFLGIMLYMASREETAIGFLNGLRSVGRKKNLGLASLLAGASSILIMALFVYASLLAPSLMISLGKEANIPTMAEGTRFYHPILYPLAIVAVVSIPGYFLSKELGSLGYLGVIVFGVALGGISVAAVDKGLLTPAPLEAKITNYKIAFGVPLSIVVASVLVASIAYTLLRKRRLGRHVVMRDVSLKVLHLGVVVTLLGIFLSGAFAFNDKYFQSYNIKPGETFEFGDLEITLVNYTYYPSQGEVDLYSHVSGKRQTALAAWQALKLVKNDIPPAIEAVKLAAASSGSKGLASLLMDILDSSGSLGFEWLNITGKGSILAVSPEGNTTIVEQGDITIAVLNPVLVVRLSPVLTSNGEIQGGVLVLGINGTDAELETSHTGLGTGLNTSKAFVISMDPPVTVSLNNLRVTLEQVILQTPESEESGDLGTLGPRTTNSQTSGTGPLLIVTRGSVAYQGSEFKLPYNVGRGLFLYLQVERGDAIVLKKVISSPLASIMSDSNNLNMAIGGTPGRVELPRDTLSGVRLGLLFAIKDGKEKVYEKAVVRFEANGEAIGIHGLVSDTIIIRKGISDIYLSIQPPMVQGFFDTYHELLVYYIKQVLGRYPPEQALSLAALMAAGYNIASVSSLSLLLAGFIVEQAMMDLLILAQEFDPSNSTITREGIPVLVKVIPNVDIVWAGAALMAIGGTLLSLGYAIRARSEGT